MKFIRILVFLLFLMPFASNAASNDFMVAAQLLAAAKNADIQQVQSLVNAGANVNFVDSTGLSIVCTALMNNDVRAAQILQMYGADASKCDAQIKKYNNRTKPKNTGGLFSGLSSAQSLTLAAAGAAVVVGGLFLLTDVFNPGNGNSSGSSGGNRPNNNPDDDSSNNNGGNVAITVPYSPAYLGADGKITTDNSVYAANLLSWNPGGENVRTWDFNYFRPTQQPGNNFVVDGILLPVQNYLLMMHGYSAFANEYMGQAIFRDVTTRNPVPVGNKAGGGKPVSVAIITANGLNPTGSAARGGGITYADTANVSANTDLLDKYLNYANPNKTTGVLGAENMGFDFSGSGTAMNPFATAYQSSLGKIIAGWYGTTNDLAEADVRGYGDFFGFVPNGRLAVLRTGYGKQWVDVTNPTDGAVAGTVTDADDNSAINAGDTIVLNGVTYNLKLALDDTTLTNPTITIGETTYKLDENSKMLVGKCAEEDCTDSNIAIYQGTDGYYYVNTTGGDTVDAVYVMDGNNLFVQKELQNADFKNFEALYNARNSGAAVIANLSLLEASRAGNYKTIQDMPVFVGSSSLADNEDFARLVNSVYEQDFKGGTTQGDYANQLFNAYGAASPILVMPAGEFLWDNGMVLDATFENYVPVLYGSNVTNRFMTVVAVNHTKGTSGASTIGGYGNGVGESYGPLYLSMYSKDVNNTPDDTSDDIMYSSRKCGVAGTGVGAIDPWCFAAAGATAEMATASAAGAVASLQAAFDYMSKSQIYQLLALTADGYLLGTDTSGNAFTKETLTAYLKNMYSLPPEYYANTLTAEKYLEAFAETYGYGLINLERATTPSKSIYFYDGNKIVSAEGNAYWRAASNTAFRPSAVLSLNDGSISAPFYDVLESVDGSMSLARVWENEFSFGTKDSRGLYMGDVLGGLKTTRDNTQKIKVGNLDFSMVVSERAYDDYMGGLDNLTLSYDSGNWNLGASYQRYLTDGKSRFNGLHNPVMALGSNAVVSNAEYNYGKLSFGGHVFSGSITDEGLLENDPTISSQYMPARLGLMHGADSYIAWKGDKLALKSSFGVANETDTLLGAYTDGLLNLGAGNTVYADAEAVYNFSDKLNFVARATFAKTKSDASGNFILGLSDIYSNAFAFGANVGNFEFSVSQPLAITDGALQYAYAKYEVDEESKLNIIDTHVADLSLSPNVRETRFMGTYRHNFGEFTDGAFGFIYRVNPNHTDKFGNESIFMLKLSHRLGI
ncbi:MAG: ankyrin repeat domain-containing protein [Alphaproteobacteria bacterium]|nr:ankyrin repeat domain-containing protein [Alphaproteobacteria bacterium]